MNEKEKIIDSSTKRSFFWNTAAGMLNSFQLFILLLIIPRTNGQEAAGIVSGAFAIGNLVMAIGKYGMRNFQVSDVNNKYTDYTYYISRIVTCIVMILCFLVYSSLLFMKGSYSLEKLIVVLLVCFLKTLDAYEDVFHGMLQRSNYFDIASRAIAIRLFVTILVEVILLIVSKNLILSFALSLGVSLILFLLLTLKSTTQYWNNQKTNISRVISVLKECLPLGLWLFVNMYMGNFPKYAIDAYFTEDVQASFNYIFMPVFTINLLNTFIFQPLITKVSFFWKDRMLNRFLKVILTQNILIAVITGLAMTLGYFIGIPILEVVFATDLSGYRIELLLCLMSGGLLALSSLFAMVLTIMRQQKVILWLYGISAIAAFFMQHVMVNRYDVIGIIVLYLVVLILLTIGLGAVMIFKINDYKHKEEM